MFVYFESEGTWFRGAAKERVVERCCFWMQGASASGGVHRITLMGAAARDASALCAVGVKVYVGNVDLKHVAE